MNRQDIVGRDIVLGKPPLDAIFYNVVPDSRVTSVRNTFEFDYILGDSDATRVPERKLGDSTLVYWSSLPEDDQISFDDPLIVRFNETHPDVAIEGLSRGEISPDWLCLRRAGKEDRTLYAEDGRLYVRSKKAGTDEVVVDIVEMSAVQGRVFSRFDKPLDAPRVTVAAGLPFAPSI